MTSEYRLPESASLDILAFSRLFSDVTNSYKFLFTLALIHNLERHFYKTTRIALLDLQADMLLTAWYPHAYFKLSFGKLDKVSSVLTEVGKELVGKRINEKDRSKLYAELKSISERSPDVFGDLLRFVPFRLIRPFFAEEVKGMKDHSVNGKVAELSETYFASRKPLYKLSAKPTHIEIHPDWLFYIKTNAPIIKAWINWHWLKYMQHCNPSSPNVAEKLFYPEERSSLDSQSKYWRTFLTKSETTCIYSGEVLSAESISLDHYIPWSFVTHDLLWNLIPTTRTANSSKSDHLADDCYFEKFVELQHRFLTFNANALRGPEFAKLTEPYLRDLRTAETSSLLNLVHLTSAYNHNIKPIISLAIANGFAGGWQFRPPDSASLE